MVRARMKDLDAVFAGTRQRYVVSVQTSEILAAIWLEEWVVCHSKSSREHHFVNLGGLGERFLPPP
ncbi:MAG: hypothetical protein SWK90_00005, partial [Chloroflexota bacterium]|nr:hypothetical protein [Chloroflexota bacterium]